MFFRLLPSTNSPQLVLSVGLGAMASPKAEIEIIRGYLSGFNNLFHSNIVEVKN
jgi:hypothetical protein